MGKSKIKTLFLVSLALFTASIAVSLLLLFGGGEKRETLNIPDYVGKKLTDIHPSSMFLIESKGVYSDAPEGEIISQTPYAGAERKIKKGKRYKIELLVSLGKKRNSVPDVRGYNYAEAAGILRELGANVRTVDIFDENAEKDTVIRTSPEIGKELNDGDRVTLFVAKTRVKGSVTVGNYVGLSREDALTRLLADGLALGETELKASSQKSDTVLSQSIKEGSLVPYGTKIDFAISEGQKEEDLHPFGRYQSKKSNN